MYIIIMSSSSSKKSSSKKSTHHYNVTFHGLHKWHEHMFEKLGWMVLAKKHGYSDKYKSYINGCKRLKEALDQEVSNDKRPENDKEDLRVLHRNAETLCEVADKLLKGSMVPTMKGGNRKHRRTMKGGFFATMDKKMKTPM